MNASNSSKIHIFTTFLKSKVKERNLEYVKCLERNNNNQFIKSINIISEDESITPLISFDKVNFIKVNQRPTFRSIIDYINYNVRKDEVVLFTNADIYFDDSLRFIKFDRNYAYCLTRIEEKIINDQIRHICDTNDYSYDTWVLKTPIIIDNIDFYMGMFGCDSVIAFRFLESGYFPINPSLLVKCYHLHDSEVRTWNKKDQLLGDYLAIKRSDEIKYIHENLYKCNIKLINGNFVATEKDYTMNNWK
jgi:disulfide oxidoreductase YuzD